MFGLGPYTTNASLVPAIRIGKTNAVKAMITSSIKLSNPTEKYGGD